MLKNYIKKTFSFFGFEVKKKVRRSKVADQFSLNQDVSTFEWLKNFKISTIIDVGANEGQFVEKILGVFPHAKIYCFEPLKPVYEQLKVRYLGNDKVVAYNLGLGDTNEEKLIHFNEYSPSSSLLDMLDLHKSNFDFAVKSEPLNISIRRLDEVLGHNLELPVLLKIDVQGYEMNVLRGADKIVEKAGVVIVETTFVRLYKDQPLFGEIYDYFTSRGFYFAGNIEQLVSPKDHQILQADAVFIRSVS